MAEPDHTTPGASLADRLLRRGRSRGRIGTADAIAARFGMADPADVGSGPGADGFVTLSIRPYLQAMSRLAQARQRRDSRLSRMLERHAERSAPKAFRRLPGNAPRRTGLAALFGSRTLGGSDFVLPERADRDLTELPEEAQFAAPAGSTYTSTRVPRPAASAWLSTPWSGARVARTPVRSTVVERTSASLTTAPSGSRDAVARGPAPRRTSALERAGQRSLAVRGGTDRVSRAIEDATPALERSSRGRTLARRLRAAAERPAVERDQIVRRILSQAGGPTRSALASVEAASPQVSPSRRASERMVRSTGPARGLRPVMSRSPGMQALVPTTPAPVETAETLSAPTARPAAVAAARMTERKSAWLSGSPVRRARAARRALSASPVVDTRAPTPAAPRASQTTAARVRRAAAAPVTDRAPAAVASGAATAASTSTRSPRARASSGGTSAAGSGPDSLGDPGDPGDPAPGQGFRTGAVAPTARAARRLAATTVALADVSGRADDAPSSGAALRLAQDGLARSGRGGLEVRRSAAGVYVPARVLATADPLSSAETDPAAAPAPMAAPRPPNVPTPARRAEYVQGLSSTATVARTPASRHAASRSDLAERRGSVLPATRPAGTDLAAARRSGGAAGDPVSAGTPLRRLGATRDPAGTFVARRAQVAAPGTPDAASRPAEHAAVRTGPGTTARQATARQATAGKAQASAPTSQVTAAAERSTRAPLVGAASSRALDGAPAGVEHQVTTRHRPNPASYARAFGLTSPDQVVVETVDLPAADAATPTAAAPTAAAPTAAAARPGGASVASRRPSATASGAPAGGSASGAPRAGSAAQALARVEARAKAGQSALRTRQAVAAGLPRTRGIRWSPSLSFDPVVISHRLSDAPAQELEATGALTGGTPGAAWTGASVVRGGQTTAGDGARVARTAAGTYVGASTGQGALPVDWAGARTTRTAGRRSDLARSVRTPRGRFDGAGTYRVPGRGAPSGSRRGAPAAPRRARVADDFTALRPDGSAGQPVDGVGAAATARESAWFTGPTHPGDDRVRPAFDVTVAAAHAGMDGQGLPVWARRAGGEPLIHREDRFVDALARASTPEDIVRVIYQRAEQGALSAGASALPAPVLSVIEQIRTVAEGVQAAPAADGPMAGPGSDAEVVRRARGGTRAPAASSSRVSRGSLLRSRGSASRRDGVGSDQISKLSKKLQQLILLAQQQRSAAREEVRMAEDSASARAEGSSAPGQAEGGNNNKVDIEALGREVLEVVTLELEMRKQRSQEGSDEFGWW